MQVFNSRREQAWFDHGKLGIFQAIVSDPQECCLGSQSGMRSLIYTSTIALPSKFGTAILPLVRRRPEFIVPQMSWERVGTEAAASARFLS
jgi:hypothetical protein